MGGHDSELNAINKMSTPFASATPWLSAGLIIAVCSLPPLMPTVAANTDANDVVSNQDLQSIESSTLDADVDPGHNLTLKKCGTALLKVLFWQVYESSLYTPDGTWQDGIRPFRLDIRYLRTISAEDLVKQTGKEWAEQGKASPQHTTWMEDLRTLWPDVTSDDVISLAVDEAGVSTFLFNGEVIGRLQDPQFGEDFSGIWLAENTTRPKLRAQLIGTAK